MRILRLFPDTNLFLQCKSLDEVSWDEWPDFDEIHLIVSHVVQREIDHRKIGHNARTTRRARKTATRFRRIVQHTPTGEVIRPANPRVVLLVSTHYWHTPDLPLDYTINDNQLVGILHAAVTEHCGEDVRLLTHDVFPLATARGLGLQADSIPDTWLLEPEPTSHEKRIRELEGELRLLQTKEPRCFVECQTTEGEAVDAIHVEYDYFPELSQGQIDDLMQIIVHVFPEHSDFGPSETRTRTVRSGLLRYQQSYVPVEAKDIERYQREYRRWLGRCRSIVARYHSILQKGTHLERIVFLLRNAGTRPADDVLISFVSSGGFQIVVSGNRDYDNQGSLIDGNLECELKEWPRPPEGQWTSSLQQIAAGLQSLNRDPFTPSPSVLEHRPPFRTPDLPNLRQDPNEFYFRDGEAGTPGNRASLTCDQLRHGPTVETFSVDICDVDPVGATGAISCHVEAANLSKLVTKTVPLTASTKIMDTFSRAKQEIESLLRTTQLAEQSRSRRVK